MNKQRFLMIGLLLLALLAMSGWFRSCQNERAANERVQTVRTELTKTVDKLGRANFTLQSLEGSYKDLSRINAGKDSTLARLQALVAERGKKGDVRSAVSFGAVAKGKASGISHVSGANTYREERVDSLDLINLLNAGGDTALVIRALVSSKRFDPSQPPTITAQVVARRDSTFLDPYTVRVGFDVAQVVEGRKVVTTIRPTDPNIDVTTAASYTQELPKKNRGLWASVGAVIVLLLTFVVK